VYGYGIAIADYVRSLQQQADKRQEHCSAAAADGEARRRHGRKCTSLYVATVDQSVVLHPPLLFVLCSLRGPLLFHRVPSRKKGGKEDGEERSVSVHASATRDDSTHHTTHTPRSSSHTRGLFLSFIMLSCSSLVVLVHTKIRVHARRPSPELSTGSYPRPFLLISISKLDDSVLEIVQRLALNSPFPGAAGAALVKNRASRELVGKERDRCK